MCIYVVCMYVPKQSDPRAGRDPPVREQVRSAPVQRTKRPQTLRIITKDLIRELK